jgi:hypothetical protein
MYFLKRIVITGAKEECPEDCQEEKSLRGMVRNKKL